MSSVMLRAALQRARQDEWEAMSGSFADFQGVVKGFVGDVGDVDDHAEPIHFADDILAEIA